jgi:hypothetical protein
VRVIIPLVQKLAGLHGVPFEPVGATPALDRVTDQLPSVPRDLREYLHHCLLAESYGGEPIQLHGLDSLVESNISLLPGADVIGQGFLCIAKNGSKGVDGGQFAYYCHNGRVYFLADTAGINAQETIDSSQGHWDTLQEFLEECAELVENAA